MRSARGGGQQGRPASRKEGKFSAKIVYLVDYRYSIRLIVDSFSLISMPAIKKAMVVPAFVVKNAVLPLGLKVDEVIKAIGATYDLIYELNNFLVKKKIERLETLILGNSFSGIISEFLVRNISNCSVAVVRNEKIGGHPDLIKRDAYHNNQVLKGDGLEIKASKHSGGWQGHNPEDIWLIVFRYELDETTSDPYKREPVTFVQVLAAELKKSDWKFSGRIGDSRRTPTASILSSGMDKLRSNPIYQDPAFIVASNKKLEKKYRDISKH